MTQYVDLKPGDMILVKPKKHNNNRIRVLIWLSVKSNYSVYGVTSCDGKFDIHEWEHVNQTSSSIESDDSVVLIRADAL